MKFKTLGEIAITFESEAQCIAYLEKIKWDGNIVSPFDPISKVYVCKNNNYRCKNTGKYFNVKTGTLFYNSKIPLQKWFMGIWLVAQRPTITSVELGEKLKVTQKSAWYMFKRIKDSILEDIPIIATVSKNLKGLSIDDHIKNIEVIADAEKLKMSQWLKNLKNN